MTAIKGQCQRPIVIADDVLCEGGAGEIVRTKLLSDLSLPAA